MSNDSNGSESVERGFIIKDQQESTLEDSKNNVSDLKDKPSSPLTSIKHDQESWAMKKDLIMVHLLHLACASKGPLSDSLQEMSSELYRLGIFSEWAKDLVAKPLQFFKEDFVNSFGEHMGSSLNPQFWDSSDLEVFASRPSSRYHNDFEEIASLGKWPRSPVCNINMLFAFIRGEEKCCGGMLPTLSCGMFGKNAMNGSFGTELEVFMRFGTTSKV